MCIYGILVGKIDQLRPMDSVWATRDGGVGSKFGGLTANFGEMEI